MHLLKIKNLVSGYGSVQILYGANMKVDQQSIVALLGGNGTGKSTNFNKHYLFDLDNVESFALFCIESGGFEIC